ncbi:hypothetical protein ABMX85_21415 [Vibrio vulnificus]|uniref:hypothetical protein n=1 Tax=Vibrio vulnificus TaxID=672 RepID=UPI004059CB22
MSKTKKAISSLASWITDWFISHGPTLIAAFIGGGGMAYLASISEPVSKFGVIGWLSIGLVAFFILGATFACFGVWRERSTLAEFTKKSMYVNASNPLSPIHKDEKINLIDFYHPFYKAARNIRFENCDLMGPANIYADGGTFDQCGFNDCEIIIVRTDRPIKGGIHLHRPFLVNCHLYRVTFIMPLEQYQSLPKQMKDGIPVISDGRVGDI